MDSINSIKLQKYFTDCGIMSRRAAEKEIAEGRVKVNGVTADYNVDGSYWAFYIDGAYAMTGLDDTPIDENATYSLVYSKF